MPKLESLFDLRRTFGSYTVVKSRRNGDHVRAARGTHKEAKLNETCERERKNLMTAVTPAKILKDALDPYRQDFKDGGLWQRLVSIFQRQIRECGAFDFSKVEPFDLYPDYPFDRLVHSFECTCVAVKRNGQLSVNVSWEGHHKTRSRNVDGFKVEAIGIFPDTERNTADTIHTDSVITGTGPAHLEVTLPVPAPASSFLVCVKMVASVSGRTDAIMGNMGMKVVGSGIVG